MLEQTPIPQNQLDSKVEENQSFHYHQTEKSLQPASVDGNEQGKNETPKKATA